MAEIFMQVSVDTDINIEQYSNSHFILLAILYKEALIFGRFMSLLRTVPPFVTAHTFCPSRDIRVS